MSTHDLFAILAVPDPEDRPPARACKRGHREWRRRPDPRTRSGASWECRACQLPVRAAAQRAYAARGGEAFLRHERARKKRARLAREEE